MAYTDEQLERAGRLHADHLVQQDRRLTNLEGKPAENAFNEAWQAGRQRAREAGYRTETELASLEDFMVQEKVYRHEHAIQLRDAPKPSRGWGLAVLPADEVKALMEQDENAYFNLAIPRAL